MSTVAQITEQRSVTVRSDDTVFEFVADPDRGHLEIREHPDGEQPSTVCALTIDDLEELEGFLAGLHRVLGRPTSPAPPPAAARAPNAEHAAAEERVYRARQRDPKAFAAWTKAEEQELEVEFRRGMPLGRPPRCMGGRGAPSSCASTSWACDRPTCNNPARP